MSRRAKPQPVEIDPGQSTGQATHFTMTIRSTFVIIALLNVFSAARSVASPKKHILVIGEEKGYRHEAVSHAMATIEN
jgi:hypothetical protein